MNLCIDIGNTRTKLGIFDDENTTIATRRAGKIGTRVLDNLIDAYGIKNVIVSSVAKADEELGRFFAGEVQYFIELTHQTPLPVENLYKTPETLGKDRLAGAIGAWQEFPLQHNLVVDAGTCLKFDLITADAKYHGGSIHPGIDMRFQALQHFTARLPLYDGRDVPGLIGDSTETAIKSGVLQGILAETSAMIDLYRSEYDDLNVVITGGDAVFLERRLKKQIFARPNLVLNGLNKILTHNVHLSKT